MPEIILEGHDNIYNARDVLGMFFTEISEGANFLKSYPEDYCKIKSVFEDGYVLTVWNSKSETGRISRKVSHEETKSEIKRQLYMALSDITGIKMPWGSLTGIRPTLVASNLKYDKEKLVEHYLVSEKKADIAVKVAKTEDGIKGRLGKEKIHLYIGIPICRTRCAYCSFLSGEYSVYSDWLPMYMKALIREIKVFLPLLKSRIDSVYIGGGTPSVIDEKQLKDLLLSIQDSLGGKELMEYTFEAGRADSLTEKKLDILKNYKVDRICINPQSLNEKTLERIGRKHSVGEFFKAYDMAVKKGFKTVNADIISGLPGETEKDFKYTVEKLIDLGPENITVHTLSVKKNSNMKKVLKRNAYKVFDDTVSNMTGFAYDTLCRNEYIPYYLYRQKDTYSGQENIGYSKQGHYCRYNVAMMGDNNSVLGLGAKSVSKIIESRNNGIEIKRYGNIKDIILYSQNVEKNIDEKMKFFNL